MADIKQAAKWMQMGKTVRRKDEPNRYWRSKPTGWLEVSERDELWRTEQWHYDDLLADDWQLVD